MRSSSISPKCTSHLGIGLETLRHPRFGLKEEEIRSTAAVYIDYCTVVEIPDPPPATPKCDDESDQKFLILAYQAGVDALVSGDGRLLVLKEESKIRILSKREFIVAIKQTLRHWNAHAVHHPERARRRTHSKAAREPNRQRLPTFAELPR